ncbi:hypothetical protein T12_16005, partial [Trichinella patagoniensis]
LGHFPTSIIPCPARQRWQGIYGKGYSFPMLA